MIYCNEIEQLNTGCNEIELYVGSRMYYLKITFKGPVYTRNIVSFILLQIFSSF